MKKKLVAAAAPCLALALSACGQTRLPPARPAIRSPPHLPEHPLLSRVLRNAACLRAGQRRARSLVMEVEGQTEEVPATLYEGEGYSIYIPDEGWTKVIMGKCSQGGLWTSGCPTSTRR